MASHAIQGRILDIGFAEYPNRYLSGTEVIGLDLEPCTPPSNYTAAIKGDVFDLPAPFEPASFDCIVAGEIIEHTYDPVRFLGHLASTLKDDGTLILSTPNPHSPFETIANIFLNRRFLYAKDHVTLYPQRWLIRILEISGFENVRLISGGIQFPFIGKGQAPSFGLAPFPRPFCYQTIAICKKRN